MSKLSEGLASLGLLILRLGAGGLMFYGHGWGKLATFTEKNSSFPDPIGLGPSTSMALAVGAEVACAVLVMAGLLTRVAAVPLIVTMGVAAFLVHAADPLPRKELALLYLVIFTTLLLTGPGRISLDALIWRRPPATPEK